MQSFAIKTPGGIISVSFLRKVCLELYSLNIEKIFIGKRQNLFFYSKELHSKNIDWFLKKNQINLEKGEYNIMLDSTRSNFNHWFTINEFYEIVKETNKMGLKISILEEEDEYNIFLSDISLIPSENPNEFYFSLFYKKNFYRFTKPKNFTNLKEIFFKIEDESERGIIELLKKENYIQYSNYSEYLKESKNLFYKKLKKKMDKNIFIVSKNNCFDIQRIEKLCYELKKFSIGYIYISPYSCLEIQFENSNYKESLKSIIKELFGYQNYSILTEENRIEFPNYIFKFDNFIETYELIIREINQLKTNQGPILIEINKDEESWNSFFNIFIQKAIFRRGKKYDLYIHPFIQEKNYKNLNLSQLFKNFKNSILFLEHYEFIPYEQAQNILIKEIEKEKIRQCIKCYTLLDPSEILCPICESKEFRIILSPYEEIQKKLTEKNYL